MIVALKSPKQLAWAVVTLKYVSRRMNEKWVKSASRVLAEWRRPTCATEKFIRVKCQQPAHQCLGDS